MNILIGTIISVILVLCVVVTALLDLPLIVGILLAVVLIGVGIYLLDKWASSGDPSEQEISIEYDVETHSAKLYKRTGSNLNGMKIQEYSKTTTHYNPSKTVYTSATVGGVTTGGFHQTKAYLSETSQGGANKYYLWVKTLSKTELLEYDYMILEKIILTDELVEQAKTDKRVSKFLHGNELILKHLDKGSGLSDSEKHILKESLNNNDYATQANMIQKAGLASRLSWQECYDIKDWISGDVPQSNQKSDKKAQSATNDESKALRKHPSHCVYRDKKDFTCTCKRAKNHRKVCNSTSGCNHYKDDRE